VKRVLFVVDIDHACGWKQNEIEANTEKQKIAQTIKNLLATRRAAKDLISFVVLNTNRRVSGQEAQINFQTLNGKPTDNVVSTFRDVSESECIVCGQPGKLAEFLEHRHGEHGEAAFIKIQCNAFTNLKIPEYFLSQGVTEIELVGCSRGSCVLATAIGALRAGFNVTLLSNCTYPAFPNDVEKEMWIQNVKSEAGEAMSTVRIL